MIGCCFYQERSMRGYGTVWSEGRDQRAHRLYWRINRGSIPEGMGVLHKCNNKLCVNPDHLYLGTQKENARDSMEAGTFKIGGWRKHLTHCLNGHPFSSENTYIRKNGQRRCRKCHNEREKKRK